MLLSAQALTLLEQAREISDEDLVFDMTNQRRSWEKARTALGRSELRWHDLRHVAATWLRQYGGLELNAVGKALGHSNLSSTTRYVHDSELTKAFDAFPNLLNPSLPVGNTVEDRLETGQ